MRYVRVWYKNKEFNIPFDWEEYKASNYNSWVHLKEIICQKLALETLSMIWCVDGDGEVCTVACQEDLDSLENMEEMEFVVDNDTTTLQMTSEMASLKMQDEKKTEDNEDKFPLLTLIEHHEKHLSGLELLSFFTLLVLFTLLYWVDRKGDIRAIIWEAKYISVIWTVRIAVRVWTNARLEKVQGWRKLVAWLKYEQEYCRACDFYWKELRGQVMACTQPNLVGKTVFRRYRSSLFKEAWKPMKVTQFIATDGGTAKKHTIQLEDEWGTIEALHCTVAPHTVSLFDWIPLIDGNEELTRRVIVALRL